MRLNAIAVSLCLALTMLGAAPLQALIKTEKDEKLDRGRAYHGRYFWGRVPKTVRRRIGADWLDHTFSLTIDDGPKYRHNITAQVLTTLKRFGVRATFFITTRHLQTRRGRALLMRILREGHRVAHHSHSHRYFDTLSNAQIKTELETGFALLNKAVAQAGREHHNNPATYRVAPLFRWPGGLSRTDTERLRYVQSLYPKLVIVDWNIGSEDTRVGRELRRTFRRGTHCDDERLGDATCALVRSYWKLGADWQDLERFDRDRLNVEATLHRTLTNYRNHRKGIILMHDKHTWSATFLDRFLGTLQRSKTLHRSVAVY